MDHFADSIENKCEQMRLGSRESSEKSINYNNLRKKYMKRLTRLKWRGRSGIPDTRR